MPPRLAAALMFALGAGMVWNILGLLLVLVSGQDKPEN